MTGRKRPRSSRKPLKDPKQALREWEGPLKEAKKASKDILVPTLCVEDCSGARERRPGLRGFGYLSSLAIIARARAIASSWVAKTIPS